MMIVIIPSVALMVLLATATLVCTDPGLRLQAAVQTVLLGILTASTLVGQLKRR